MENITLNTQKAIQLGQGLAAKNGHSSIEPIHIFFGCLSTDHDFCETLLKKSGISFQDLKADLKKEFEKPQGKMNEQQQTSFRYNYLVPKAAQSFIT